MSGAALNQLSAALIQIAAAFLIAGVVWVIFGRKRIGFTGYVGLRPAAAAPLAWGAVIGLALALVLLASSSIRELANGPNTVLAMARRDAHGASLVLLLLVLAIVKTAFAEELIFRGLIAKRLIAWLGFAAGNAVQAAIFGALHLVIVKSAASEGKMAAAMLSILFVMALGWMNGWLNERRGGGSILPGWTAHATANILTYLTLGLGVLS